MKNLGRLLGLAMLVAAVAAVAAQAVPPSATLRYKITVNVDTPEGLKAGSAVREADIKLVPKFPPETLQAEIDIKGEAVVVDMGKRGQLFALINGPDDYRIVFDAFPGPPGLTPEGLEYYKNLKNAKATLTLKQYPRLVMFKDRNDPKTVQQVLETALEEKPGVPFFKQKVFVKSDRFEELFGPGVKLRDVTIEMTNEVVGWKIEETLPWLEKISRQQARLNGSTSVAITTNELADNLGSGHFKSE